MKHIDLIKFGQILGYKLGNGGLCNGFSMMWIQAACNNKLDDFYTRLRLLDTFLSNPQALPKEIDHVRNLVKQKIMLSLQQKQILEIPAFYEGILLYLNPDDAEPAMVFNKYLSQKNSDEISAFVQPETAASSLSKKQISDQKIIIKKWC